MKPNQTKALIDARVLWLFMGGVICWVVVGIVLIFYAAQPECGIHLEGRRGRAVSMYLCSYKLLSQGIIEWLLFFWLWLPFLTAARWILKMKLKSTEN